MLQNTQRTFRKDNDTFLITETKGQQLAYQQAVQALAMNLQGNVVLPGDADFEAARAVWNGAWNRYPALIVHCSDAKDVIAAVTFAREQGLEVSVRSGGHSMVGYGTNDGGMVIDLSDSIRTSNRPCNGWSIGCRFGHKCWAEDPLSEPAAY